MTTVSTTAATTVALPEVRDLPPNVLWRLEQVSVDKRITEVSIEIERGVTAVLGASGSGKSTLLDVLCGHVRPTRGTVTASDEISATDAAAGNDSAAGTPLMWAGFGEGLWPHLTVAEQILAVGGEPQDWLPRFELEERNQVYPAQLSQGERSRCELARALASRPRVLVLDEPLTHVDRRRTSAGWQELTDWAAEEGHQLIVATHDIAAARQIAQRVVCLDGGRVVDSGPAERVYESPRSPEAAWAVGGDA